MGEVVSLFVSRETGLRWFRVVICGLGWLICGLGLTWEVYVIKTLSMCSSSLHTITKTYSGCQESGLGRFGGSLGCFYGPTIFYGLSPPFR